MNLEQLLHHCVKKFPHHREAYVAAYNRTKLHEYHMQKLKLGALVFEIKEPDLSLLRAHETIDIKYTRQDTTEEDALKLENRLISLQWRWDIYSILAFLIIFFFILLFIYVEIYNWYVDNLSFLNDSGYKKKAAIDFAYNTFFKETYNFSHSFRFLNSWFNSVLIDMCQYYEILK